MSGQILPHRTLENDQNQIITNNFRAEVRLHFETAKQLQR